MASGGSSSNNNSDGNNRAEMQQGTLKKGPWTEEEDRILKEHVRAHGEGNWNSCHTISGLMRCGKSCRLRWVNNLRPNLKKGAFSAEEEAKIVRLHAEFGSKWSFIASQLPGRSDNEIKNYWNTRVKRRQKANNANKPVFENHQQESNMPSSSILPSPKQAQNPTSPAIISIYDVFKTSSSTGFPNSLYISQPSGSSNLLHQNNGLSYGQNGAAYSHQMQELPSAELFAPMTTPTTAFGNIGASGHANLGLLRDLSLDHEGTGSHVHASIGAGSPRETNQVDDEFLSLLHTPALTMSMNDWFDKDGNMVPNNNDHTPSFGGW